MRLFCFLLLLLPFGGLAQSKADRRVLAVEQQRFELMMQRDTVGLRPLLAEDLSYMHSNALQEHKADHLTAISTGRLVYSSMVREMAQVRHYGKIALVNGVIRVQGSIKGTAFEVRLAYTAVYRRHHRHWLLVNWQSTKIS